MAAYTNRRLAEEKSEVVNGLMRVFQMWLDAQLAHFEQAFNENGAKQRLKTDDGYTRVERASAAIRDELPPRIRRVFEEEVELETRGAEHRVASRLADVVCIILSRLSQGSTQPESVLEGAVDIESAMRLLAEMEGPG